MFGFKKELYTPEYQLAGDECAVIETSKGTIKVKFDGEGAPIHVANFCELSTMGFYDGLKFHRYVPGFVIQGGDPIPAICPAPTSLPVLRPRRHAWYRWPRLLHQGRVCYQSAQQPCRWSSCHGTLHGPRFRGFAVLLLPGRQHNLDSGYTVFGTTVEGLDVISQLRAGDEIVHVEIVHE